MLRLIAALQCLVAALGVSIALSTPASAVTPSSPGTLVYQFTGDCDDCSNALGILTLTADYQLGDPIRPSFLSFVYSSDKISFYDTYLNTKASGALPVDLPGFPASFISFDNGNFKEFFSSATDGHWSVGLADIGTNGTWQAAPEPASLGLLGVDLVAAAVARRHKRTA
ncbi:MAG: PEP-CTERM sorting domain-containing protein [Proteobacteria bacterium]|nr:PEP-CTERM sorting domain-containing protein [Pseudomonadota bacterium]